MKLPAHFALFFLMFCFGFAGSAWGETDAEYENRMHNIYLKYYKDPVPYSKWSELIKSLARSYQLKYKDNFWDLSGKFFRDSLYWSKLWVANPETENPHRIFKGDFIKFDAKSLQDAINSEYSVDIASQFPPDLAEPNKNAKKSLPASQFPSSLPFLQNPFFAPSPDIVFRLEPLEPKKEAILPFYLAEEDPPAQGTVVSKDGRGSVAFNGEHVIVEMEGGPVIQSGLYTVFENLGPFRSSIMDFSDHGSEIKIKGEIKILSYLSESGSMYRALVTKSLRAISAGDQLLQGPAPVYRLSQKGDPGSASGSIIGVPEGEISMLSIYSLAYLNKGEADGVRPGDIYHIRASSQYRLMRRPYQYEDAPVGSLRVAHVNPQRATAIITGNRNQIYAGDTWTGASGFIEDLSQSASHEEAGSIEERPSAVPEEKGIPEYGEEIEESYMEALEEREGDSEEGLESGSADAFDGFEEDMSEDESDEEEEDGGEDEAEDDEEEEDDEE